MRSHLMTLFLCALPLPSLAADMRFDVVTFNATPEYSVDHMNQTLFNDLNFPTLDGHTIAMGGDSHRPDLTAAGNTLGSYYDTLTTLYTNQSTKSGSAAADSLEAYVNKATTTGPAPNWIVLNEISSSLWQNSTSTGDTYRQWLVDCVTKLHDTYNLNVILYAPFPNPGAHSDTWKALAPECYIGVENYLSGSEIKAADFSLSWVQSQYASSIASYANLGVPASRLILGEDYAQTTAATPYGRSGVSLADWEAAIRLRAQAIYNLPFAGAIGYAWGKNNMQVSDADILYAEDVYRSCMISPTEKPQWIVSTGGSWSTRNNWLAYSNIPNNPGDIATFDKTFSAPATITLDGTHNIGALNFNSPYSITLSPGTGGALILNNNASTPTITVSQGSHKISATLAFASPASLAISPGASLDLTTNTLTLSSAADSLTALRQYLYNHQLISSTTDSAHTLGYRLNPNNSITLQPTLIGDANLDQKITPDDYTLLDKSFAKQTTDAHWIDGDFNYDGIINSQDYLLLDTAYLTAHGSAMSSFFTQREAQFGDAYVNQLLTALPEPSPLIACFLAALLLHPRPPPKHSNGPQYDKSGILYAIITALIPPRFLI